MTEETGRITQTNIHGNMFIAYIAKGESVTVRYFSAGPGYLEI
jgi:hypothetical protein